MSKVTVLGNVLQLKSEMTMNDLVRAKRFKPEALQVKKDDKVIFEVAPSTEASISKHGICFAGADRDGKLFLVDNNPACPLEGVSEEEVKAKVSEKYAEIINNLNIVEGQVEDATKELNQLEADMTKNIVVN